MVDRGPRNGREVPACSRTLRTEDRPTKAVVTARPSTRRVRDQGRPLGRGGQDATGCVAGYRSTARRYAPPVGPVLGLAGMARVDPWTAHIRREERAAAQRRRELAAQAKLQAAWQERQRAEYEVSVYENQIEFLLSIHKDCGPNWDWARVVRRAPPSPPTPQNTYEQQVRQAMARAMPQPPQPMMQYESVAQAQALAYSPTLIEKMFGGEQRRRAELENAIAVARQHDAQAFAHARAQYQLVVEQWSRELGAAQQRDVTAFNTAQAQHEIDVQRHAWEQQAGAAVLAGDLNAYRTVLTYLSPFLELTESGMNVSVGILRHDVAVLRCVVDDDSIVPQTKKELSAAGKLLNKTVPAGTYWALYQDYVCGCALRIAREVFALLPLPRVVVNVARSGLDTSTGHMAGVDILAVSIPRETAATLRYETLDPSDSLVHFPHRMKFKKTSGFESIEAMTADESFISTTNGRRR